MQRKVFTSLYYDVHHNMLPQLRRVVFLRKKDSHWQKIHKFTNNKYMYFFFLQKVELFSKHILFIKIRFSQYSNSLSNII